MDTLEIFYVTRAMIAARPRNFEGYRIPDAGWYMEDTHSGDIHGPYATAREAYQVLDEKVRGV